MLTNSPTESRSLDKTLTETQISLIRRSHSRLDCVMLCLVVISLVTLVPDGIMQLCMDNDQPITEVGCIVACWHCEAKASSVSRWALMRVRFVKQRRYNYNGQPLALRQHYRRKRLTRTDRNYRREAVSSYGWRRNLFNSCSQTFAVSNSVGVKQLRSSNYSPILFSASTTLCFAV